MIWDLPVRLFHWILVAALIGSYVTNRLGVAYFNYHVLCGCTVLVLVTFRLIWGFVGTRHALFRNFLRGPSAVLKHAGGLLRGRIETHPGHNPLGALMILFLLLGLAVQATTGLFSTDDIFNTGPLYGWISHQTSLELSSIHRRLFYVLAAAVSLHVLAAIFYTAFGPDHLIRAMITGRKATAGRHAIESSRLWIALAIVLVLAAVLIWILAHAPAPQVDLGT